MEDIISFINEVVKKYEYVDREVKSEDKLKADLGLDSLGILTLVDELEDKFQIALEPEELQSNPETIGDLASIVKGKL